MKTLYFATHNAHKLAEARAILSGTVEVLDLSRLGCYDEIPETSLTLDGNALQKAQYVWERYHVNCFADDTGLEVEALGGAPGVFTARYAAKAGIIADDGPAANRRHLLDELRDVGNRKARFRTAVALIRDGELLTCEGVVEGTIALREMGDGGFGYDSLFIPDGYQQTFAQLPPQVKNTISHRARALQNLLKIMPL